MSEHAETSDHAYEPFSPAITPPAITPPATYSAPIPAPASDALGAWKRMGTEILAGVQTLVSAAVYATLIVTFGFQVARVEGQSMAPTLQDQEIEESYKKKKLK